MTTKISKVVRTLPFGAPGSTVTRYIAQSMLDAENQIVKAGGTILPRVTIKIVVEQEFDDNQGRNS